MSEGERIGRFQLDAPLGSGPRGTVWRGTDTAGGERVAIKRMSLLAVEDPLTRLRLGERHQREIDTVRRSSVSGLAPVLGAGFEPEEVWVVTPLYVVPSLDELLSAGADTPCVLELLAEMASSLDACHERGIVHKNVKPANLFATAAGAAWVDLTRPFAARSSLLDEEPSLGRVLYMSPEEMLGAEPSAASNRYSFTVIVHRALAGSLPHDPEDPVEYMYASAYGRVGCDPGFPEPVRKILDRGLARAPEERPPGCRQMVEELKRALPERPLPFPDLSAGPASPAPWLQRRGEAPEAGSERSPRFVPMPSEER